MSLALALQLLRYPRDLGAHPSDGKPVLANTGRFGPYVAWEGLNASLGKHAGLDDVTLEQAVEVSRRGDGCGGVMA
mgnify:CR=1 FL=1